MSEIKIMKSRCSGFPSGFCYCADNPYYSGHYATKERAAVAAVKTMRALSKAATTDAGPKGEKRWP